MSTQIKLHSYQQKVLESIRSDPSHSQLISMPTGTGKTITFLHAIKDQNKRCLVIVHREELLEQTYDKAKLCGFEENEISIIKSTKKEEFKRLNICMVQTLSRNLEKYNSDDIEMCVVDEAHHATAQSYRKIFHYFKIFEDKKILLGFTATPLRGDKDMLSSIFLSHSFKMTLSEATMQGYICPVSGLRVYMKKSLNEVETSQGDYDMAQLDKIMNCEEVNNKIVERCEHLHKVPSIVFCTSVDHAEKIANKLREKNRKAETVSYLTSKKELAEILERLKTGKLDFITNAVKLSEGFDFPPIQSIILARPTRSPVLYKQMIGRGLRLSPNKLDCLVIEFSGNDEKMICWEDIDENCTFHALTDEEKRTYREAKIFYRNKFGKDNVVVLDVRVSPFNFYECKIRRMVKYRKYFYFIPDEQGFLVFRSIPDGMQDGSHVRMRASLCLWKEKFKSFTFYDEWKNFLFGQGEYACPVKKMEEYAMQIGETQKFGVWYPSEEEPIRKDQIKILGNIKTSARKAKMMIEDLYIKKAIDKFWLSENFPDICEI